MMAHADILEGLRRHRTGSEEPFSDPTLVLWCALDLLANDFPREAVMAVIRDFLRGYIARLDVRALAEVKVEGSA